MWMQQTGSPPKKQSSMLPLAVPSCQCVNKSLHQTIKSKSPEDFPYRVTGTRLAFLPESIETKTKTLRQNITSESWGGNKAVLLLLLLQLTALRDLPSCRRTARRTPVTLGTQEGTELKVQRPSWPACTRQSHREDRAAERERGLPRSAVGPLMYTEKSWLAHTHTLGIYPWSGTEAPEKEEESELMNCQK